MDATFLQALIARFTDLTKDLLFDHKPTGGKIAPRIIDTMMPPKESDHVNFQEFPCIRLAVHEGLFDAFNPQPFSVIAQGVIWTAGTVIAGSTDIKILARAMGDIVKNRSFPPYRLVTPCPFFIGDQEQGWEGLQPHPLYYVRLHLQFILPS